MIYAFDGYEVDTDRIEIRRDGGTVHVEPQVFDVLCYLIEHRDRVVPKIELFENVWGGAFVGESALTSRIKTARQRIGDNGQAQRLIRTVQRRGYQFVGDVIERGDAVEVEDSGTQSDDTRRGTPRLGTVTFMFSDVEGSSRLWERHPDVMRAVIDRHDELLRSAIERRGGNVFATAGDGFAAAFDRASDAVAAAHDARFDLDAERWPSPIRLEVRLGLHTGEATEQDGNYLGATVNRAARVMSAAHGGQTLLSDATAGLLDNGPVLRDQGMCRIDANMPTMRLWQLGDAEFPPLASALAATPPRLRTALIGRVDDLEHVSDAVAEHRLVSVVGPGGAGKTTLALAASNAVLASFPSGVVFVELASVSDGGGIFRAVAETAGIEGVAATDVDSLAANLARRSSLLVLDNCEHLLDECADFVDAVLDADAEASVLTTSREPLGIDGEVVIPLGSMNEDAPRLFVERAAAARADVDLSADDPKVVDVCEHLDGLPLAIEIAAAQLRHLRLDDLVERLGSALELSRGGRSRGRDRHATLERTISWSYDLLDDHERWLLRQLGVFPGSFDLEAAESVGAHDDRASVHISLSDLVAKNLVVSDVHTGRYRLLETIRAFTGRLLADEGEADRAGERLREHVVRRATESSRVDRWLSGDRATVVRADLDNERFAFDRSIWAGQVTDALEIHVGASYLFRNTSNCADGRRWATRLESAVDEMNDTDRLWFTLVQADLAQGTADHRAGARAAAAAAELCELVDDDAARVIARHSVALHDVVADPDAARRQFTDLVELAGSAGEPRLTSLMQAFLSVTELSAGNDALGTDLAEDVGHAVDGGGYEVFIANWAAWTACLINRDAERLRYWRERQRDYLSRVGVPEPWLFLWSTALVTAMEGGDPIDGLRIARERADAEGHDVSADIVLALALVAELEHRDEEAARMIGVVMRQRLNNLSHYVLVRAVRATLIERMGESVAIEAMGTWSGRRPPEILAEAGLTTIGDRP